ncbi:DUF1642 domain-containing protein [uncultured Enterococcus sp.]|jgi:hypothetical protein|uniref:DUF1642 domain-containing protein n=1 Tax=uncultured Enterococcus sp. TaxID=167972 RepID=UPI0020658791|nr:DUF1642 domain-containing protein [uncultured Enterococcus sp.]DAL95775.1 MAG TPA: Protein of unknown function (DUF1642) [Caudoviricetes sp.]
MNELKYIESFSKEEIIEKMQNYLNEVEADIENPRSDADDEFVGSIKKEVWLVAIQLVKQIDERQKVKVPSFIGRWIEEVKQRGCGLADALNCFASPIMPEEVKEWLDFNFSAIGCHHDHQELLARAWLDGYEVEEDPKYYVQLPFLEWNEEAAELEQTELYLGFDITSDETRFMTNKNGYRDFKTRLDEETIKAIDERYWPFAVPVEKV